MVNGNWLVEVNAMEGRATKDRKPLIDGKESGVD